MSFAGINFRATSGFVTDGAGDTYSLGEASPVVRGGFTFGFNSDITANTRDRASGGDPRLAGIAFFANSGAAQTFTLNLPFGPGTYNIRLALGDANAGQICYCEIKDGSTSLKTIGPTVTTAGVFLDANGTLQTAWPVDNVAIQRTFAGSVMTLVLGGSAGGSAASAITHVSLEFVSGGATAVTLSGPTSGAVGVASTNFTVGANGTITGTVTVTPNDSGGGGSFSPTSVSISTGTPTATFTYTPATSGAKTIGVTNNGGLTAPSTITYTASGGAATAITKSGPTAGNIAAASTNFTVGANGTITGTVAVTPSDSGGGGTFTPTSVSISTGSPTGTFTYTPGTSGTKSISVTNNGGLTNPAASSYAVTGAVFTSEPLKDNTGALQASKALTHVALYNDTTGVLVVRKTGLYTNGSGVFSFPDAALAASTQYRIDWETSEGKRRMPRKAAA